MPGAAPAAAPAPGPVPAPAPAASAWTLSIALCALAPAAAAAAFSTSSSSSVLHVVALYGFPRFRTFSWSRGYLWATPYFASSACTSACLSLRTFVLARPGWPSAARFASLAASSNTSASALSRRPRRRVRSWCARSFGNAGTVSRGATSIWVDSTTASLSFPSPCTKK